MAGLFANGLKMETHRRTDGATVLRCNLPLPCEIPDILARLDHWALVAPDRLLLTAPDTVCRGRATLSYAKARTGARALAGLLHDELGLRRGDRVASLVPAGIGALLLKLACLEAGIVHVALPPHPFGADARGDQAGTLLHIAAPSVIFAPSGHPVFDKPETCLRGAPTATPPHRAPLGLDPLVARALADDTPRFARSHNTQSDHAAIFFTSGSTGAPKGVPVTRGMIGSCQAAIGVMWPFLANAPPVLVDWLPWHHVFGGLDNIFKMIWHGGTMHVDSAPDTGTLDASLALMADARPSLHIAVPLALRLLLDACDASPSLASAALSRLQAIFFAGAGIDAAVWNRLLALRDRHGGFQILSGYGATEAASTICLSSAPLERPGELGCPLPGHEIALVDADGRQELRVRGPNVAPCYLQAQGSAPLPLDVEGFYCTGDAARLEQRSDGRTVLVFDGRLAEDFKLSSGTKVRTGPLRAALRAECGSPVQDIVVAGENREGLVALVILGADAGAMASEAGIVRRIADAFARWNAANPATSTAIVRFGISETPPDRAKGELSDKGQIVQARFLHNHAAIFDKLHAGAGHAVCTHTESTNPTEDRT